MAYPDGTAVVRYYPVEVIFGSNFSAAIGLGLWFKNSPDGVDYTLVSLDGDEVRWSADYPWAETGWLGTIEVPLPMEGAYSERAFMLLNQQGSLVPITGDLLPLELYLSRADYTAPSGYAGGVVQVGIYQSGELVVLASFRLKGTFLQDYQIAPGGWEQLPEITDSLIEDSPPRLVLDGSLPVPAFWTQLTKVYEAA